MKKNDNGLLKNDNGIFILYKIMNKQNLDYIPNDKLMVS